MFYERSSICFCIAAITCAVDFWVGGLKLYAMRMLILCARRWCHHVKCFGFYFFNDMLYANDNDLPHSLNVSCSSNILFVIWCHCSLVAFQVNCFALDLWIKMLIMFIWTVVIRMLIRHQRWENSLATTQNSLAKFCLFPESFATILLLLYSILFLLQFLMKSVGDDVQMSYFIFTVLVRVDGHWETLGAKTKNLVRCENNNHQHRKGLHY